MSDFETLGKRAERELAAERDEELERLIYEDEQKLSGESPKKKRLRREIETLCAFFYNADYFCHPA